MSRTGPSDTSVEALAALFGPETDGSAGPVRGSNRVRTTFCTIKTWIGFKVDSLVQGTRPLDQNVLDRRAFLAFQDVSDEQIAVVAPEDFALLKLEWRRLGGEASEGQWLHALEVKRPRGGRPVPVYLADRASALGVADREIEARTEASP